MSDFEFRFKIKEGDIVLHFSNTEELKEKLDKLNEIINLINSKLEAIPIKQQSEEQKEVLPGLESVYTTTPDGLVKLLKFPNKKSDMIKLLLFVSKRPLKLSEITRSTGITNPVWSMRSKHFQKLTDGTYTLTLDGSRYVALKILPKLTIQVK
jgi:hypothetical protein